MPDVRILQGVAGLDFSWSPGEVIGMSEEDAAKWADGVRAELADKVTDEVADEAEEVDVADAVEPVVVEEPVVERVVQQPKPERAATRSRGGGRGSAKPETRD